MKGVKKNKVLKLLTFVGCFSTGIIYAAVGIIAILSFLRLKKGGADESSFFVLLNGFVAGRMLNWLIIFGAICFIIWRFYEAIKDPYKIGGDVKGIIIRTGAAFSSFADAFIAFSVFQALFSQQKALKTGEPVQQRNMAWALLENDWGAELMIAVAIIVLITAVVLMFYGLSKRFTETIDGTHFNKNQKSVLHGIAYAGYLSRGIILGIIGYSFLRAAITNNGNSVVNTDKAFDFIGDNFGGVPFILVAIGTTCYGVYMFVLGMHYDIDAKKNN